MSTDTTATATEIRIPANVLDHPRWTFTHDGQGWVTDRWAAIRVDWTDAGAHPDTIRLGGEQAVRAAKGIFGTAGGVPGGGVSPMWARLARKHGLTITRSGGVWLLRHGTEIVVSVAGLVHGVQPGDDITAHERVYATLSKVVGGDTEWTERGLWSVTADLVAEVRGAS